MDYTIWVTNSCNMQCKYCYVEDKKGKLFFQKKDIDFFIDFIKCTNKENEQIKINFFGGEPLLNIQLIQEVIERMEKEGFPNVRYLMTTNGLLLNEKNIAYMKEKAITLSLSWDGNEVANDSNRIDINGKGTYKMIREKYELLKKCGVHNLRVRATFNSSTMRYLEDSICHFLDIDKDMSVIFVADFFDSEWNQTKIDELQSIVKELEDMELHNILLLGDKEMKSSSCGGGITSYHIYSDGSIYPCSFVVNNSEFCIGNIHNGINKQKLQELISNYKKDISECQGCDYEKYCLTYKCRYLNWSLSKDLNKAVPVICQLENIKMCNNIK